MIREVNQLEVNQLDEAMVPAAADERAGFGALQTERGLLPLTALAVESRIVGLVAETSVRQTFRNSLDEPLEATYIFPLPDRAAVTGFRMRVHDRTIEGDLKERSQAREEYDAAISQGHRAAIAEEDRSGVFSLRVGNLLPKEEAKIELTMVQPLPVSDGEATFRFPLVVAPRYTPGVPLDGSSVGAGVAPDTDQVPDASRVTPPVLLPGFPNPVELSLKVELTPAGIAAGDANWTERIRSSLHSTLTDQGPPWTICLKPAERLNRDFILRFPVAESLTSTSLVCHAATADTPGTFALTLLPPASSETTSPVPRSIVFVLDRSGSMGGWKMVAARRALRRMIDTLLDQDEFTVLAFDNTLEHAPNAEHGFVSGTNRERWRMLEWLGKIDARGGTEMGPAIEAAVRLFSKAGTNHQPILVLVTDGQVTGEDAILRSLSSAKNGPTPRIFTVGIDEAVNAGFLRRLADFGHGQCELVESEGRLDEAMNRIHRLIGSPVLTQVRVEPIDFVLQEGSLAPRRVPDLFPDRPLIVYGRHPSTGGTIRLRVCGIDADGNPWQQELAGNVASLPMLKSVWGRARVRDLEDDYAASPGGNSQSLMQEIVAVSLESHVLSRFTAYVAVDRSDVANPAGRPLELVQPVEMPRGWDTLCAFQAPVQACLDSSSVAFRKALPTLSLQLHRRLDRTRQSSPEAIQASATQRPTVTRWLEDAIAARASEVRIERTWRHIRVSFLLGGKVVLRFKEPAGSWDTVVQEVRRLANLLASGDQGPQQGQIRLHVRGRDFVLHVTIKQAPRSGNVVITIPDAGTDVQGPEPPDDRKRSRFWA